MSLTITIPTLETERLILREPRITDFDRFEAFLRSDRARYIGGPAPDRWQAWRSFSNISGQWILRGYGSFVFERKDTGTAIGGGGPWHPVTWPEPELGWSLWSADDEGKGYAAEAIRAARAHAFDVLGWETAVSYIDPDNAASIALAERLGAVVDPHAALPDDDPCVVYRHPKEAA